MPTPYSAEQQPGKTPVIRWNRALNKKQPQKGTKHAIINLSFLCLFAAI